MHAPNDVPHANDSPFQWTRLFWALFAVGIVALFSFGAALILIAARNG